MGVLYIYRRLLPSGLPGSFIASRRTLTRLESGRAACRVAKLYSFDPLCELYRPRCGLPETAHTHSSRNSGRKRELCCSSVRSRGQPHAMQPISDLHGSSEQLLGEVQPFDWRSLPQLAGVGPALPLDLDTAAGQAQLPNLM